MATKSQKDAGSFFGAVLGGIIGYQRAKAQGQPSSECWGNALKGGLIGSVAGRVGAELLGSPNDTVNYRLFNQGELVYEGITFDHRVDKRMIEHERNGKKFDSYECSSSRPRTDALRIEKKRIELSNPKYNIQHNK